MSKYPNTNLQHNQYTMNDKIFNALSDPHRRKILELLREKDQCVSELLQHFWMRQASLSHHLKVLKEADLVSSQRRWQYIYYTVKKENIQDTQAFLNTFLEEPDTKEIN